MKKIKIDYKSFLRKGIKNIEENFLIALINGYQGSGKTYYGIYKLETEYKATRVYTNIKSYHSTKHHVIYFDTLEDIYNNHDKDCIFLIDELSKRYVKDSKIDRPFYSWLQQSRKHNRIVLLITQEYLQVPNWLRGIATRSFTTSKLPLLPIMITTLGTPVLDKENCEWGITTDSITVYKRNKSIASLYNTYELINQL